jgi:hypothetical protein
MPFRLRMQPGLLRNMVTENQHKILLKNFYDKDIEWRRYVTNESKKLFRT